MSFHEKTINKDIEKAHAIEFQLPNFNQSPFSSAACNILKTKIEQYIKDLINESVKVSKRHQADIVSVAHVKQASDFLVSSTSRRIYRHLGTVGGVLLGATLSNILTMTLSSQYTGGGTILSITLGIIGAFMIALQIAKD